MRNPVQPTEEMVQARPLIAEFPWLAALTDEEYAHLFGDEADEPVVVGTEAQPWAC